MTAQVFDVYFRVEVDVSDYHAWMGAIREVLQGPWIGGNDELENVRGILRIAFEPADRHSEVPIGVERDFLVRVDSVCSLVGYRGLDDESKQDLKKLSREARQLVRGHG